MIGMTNSLSITTSLNQDSIAANNSARLLYVLLQIKPGDPFDTFGRAGSSASSGPADPAPLPVNIGIVVDKSDSMCIPILSPEQFEQLAHNGQVSETIVDGVPVWQFQNVP